MIKPWTGKLGWIWYESQGGGTENIIALAKRYGMSGVLVKEADEGNRWFQTDAREIDAYHAAGLSIVAWTYAYGRDPEASADAIIGLAQAGFDGVVIDAEAELRNAETASQPGVPNLIDQMMRRVVNAIGTDYPLAVAPLPVMRYHEGLHFERWQDWGCDYLPQFYDNVLGENFGGERLFKEWSARFDMGKVYPVYGMYGATGYSGDTTAIYPTAEELAAFVERCERHGCPGWSVWRLDTIIPEIWDAAIPLEEEMTAEQKANALFQMDVLWGMAAKHTSKKRKAEQERAIVALREALGI